MSDYVIMTDSSCDLPQTLATDLDIIVLPLSFIMEDDHKEYFNYLDGREIGFEEFYAKLHDGVMSKTSAVNMNAFTEAMEPILQSGKDILYIGFSSALSTTFQSGKTAGAELMAKYPGRKVIAIDSLSSTMGQGLLVYLAVGEQRLGKNIDDLSKWVMHNRLKICHWFTADDLKYLKRGGRISGATALVGALLGIKPIVHMDNEGKLISAGKAKGRAGAYANLVTYMEKNGVNLSAQTIFMSHANAPEEAEQLSKIIQKKFHPKEIITSFVGPVIGSHGGPGTIAAFFIGTER